MARNLELKARCPSISRASVIALSLCGKRVAVLRQTDTYFNVPGGRLKIREIKGAPAEIIWYHRPNRTSERISHYTIERISRVHELKALLTRLLGVLVIVRKERHLYLHKNARIHLDRVAGLGTFVECEVILRNGSRKNFLLMKELKDRFSIRRADLVSTSYSALALQHHRRTA